MKCERCNIRRADWCLWIDNPEHRSDPTTRQEVCGQCVPAVAVRISNFAYAENPDLAAGIMAERAQ